MPDAIVETWNIHQRINLYLLEALQDEVLTASPGRTGRNIGEQWHHISKVRLMWLKQSAPELIEGADEPDKSIAGDKNALRSFLEQTGALIEQLLEKGLAEGKIKGFKPHPTAFLGYLIAHESHHRGQIALLARQLGHPLDKKTAFGLWEWGVR
ncbi:DinB family protein [Paenibacillus koleovorans]|uniref:DinB family protein n=1 Tax=Paenibacillus koleovorans TaxID=121608 RepID=UPI000FD76C7A|nr:DinB family protein [Paenibacillus koleovorans]